MSLLNLISNNETELKSRQCHDNTIPDETECYRVPETESTPGQWFMALLPSRFQQTILKGQKHDTSGSDTLLDRLRITNEYLTTLYDPISTLFQGVPRGDCLRPSIFLFQTDVVYAVRRMNVY